MTIELTTIAIGLAQTPTILWPNGHLKFLPEGNNIRHQDQQHIHQIPCNHQGIVIATIGTAYRTIGAKTDSPMTSKMTKLLCCFQVTFLKTVNHK